MSDRQSGDPASAKQPNSAAAESSHEEMEEYAGGYIEAHHGYIPVWLLVVYIVLFAWALYYGYQYWGGVGPGRI
ncbi:MAG: hypothetical protein Q8P46_08375 [Hyphomicrobiales bacterium]|nr:hypothetical protein [Hyphomicrobiales bacterium]